MTGYLNVHQAAAFLGGRSVAWLRSHLNEIPHLKLYDRLLFDPANLRSWVERTAEKKNPIDVDAIVAEVLGPQKRRRDD